MQNQYNAHNLLNALREQMKLKNDAALARTLQVAPPVLSKLRHHALPIGASMLVRMHEVSGKSIADLRDLMGDKREKFGASTLELMEAA